MRRGSGTSTVRPAPGRCVWATSAPFAVAAMKTLACFGCPEKTFDLPTRECRHQFCSPSDADAVEAASAWRGSRC